jgi:hypothetical protein
LQGVDKSSFSPQKKDQEGKVPDKEKEVPAHKEEVLTPGESCLQNKDQEPPAPGTDTSPDDAPSDPPCSSTATQVG